MILSWSCADIWAAPTTIVGNGDPANRVNIVFLGDGYTQSDLDAGIYDLHVQSYLDYMFAGGVLADPFPRYKKFFNSHKIDVVSNESGADVPSQGVYVNTALNATYETNGIDRLLSINQDIADGILDVALAGTGIVAEIRFATVNHAKYGGSGGRWSVFAGENNSAREIAIHELGHSFSNLVDEYVSFAEPYVGPEPNKANVTKYPTGSKWAPWLGFDDPRGSHLDIGVVEGAYFYASGIYRPSLSSKMRTLNQAFDAVSREAFVQDIYALVEPLDDWLDNSSSVTGDTLWVAVVDPDVISVEWYVDDVRVEGAFGEEFFAPDYGFGPGTYSVRAHAYDEIINHAFSGDMLDLVRTGLDALQQEVAWTLTIPEWLLGDYNRNDAVDEADFTLWRSQFGSLSMLDADGNGNGVVDAADYAIWRNHLGEFRAATESGVLAVPESSTRLLSMMALLLCGACIGPRSARRRLVSGPK